MSLPDEILQISADQWWSMEIATDADMRVPSVDLSRFTGAQEGLYTRALKEIKDGHKRTLCMWFVFP